MITIIYPKHYKTLSIAALKKVCFTIFTKKLANKKVVNKKTNAEIILTKAGAKHALFARTGQFEKIIALTLIDEIIKEASFEKVEESNKKEFLFFLRYKTAIKIDNKNFNVIVVVGVKTEKKLNLYYDHVLIT